MDAEELCFLPLSRVAGLIAAKELSPVDLTRAVLDRIGGLGGFACAYITVMGEAAMAEARRAEAAIRRGDYKGPLHGVPVAIKDLCDVEGVATTAGSRLMGAEPARSDSEVARLLRRAGAIVVGKTNLHEFAYGGTSVNPHFGTPPNPWDPTRVPGGSSGGSAVAVALGAAFAAIGSDTGGSIRLPAAHCGITGFKPSFGLVSRRGVFPLSMSLDHVGPMARTALDCALVLNAIAGHDPGDPYSADTAPQDFAAGIDVGISGRKLGVPSNFFFEDLDPEVNDLVKRSLEVLQQLGAELVEVELPWAQEAIDNNVNVQRPEAFWVHRERLGDPALAGKLGADTLARLRQGQGIDAAAYHGHLNRKAEITAMAAELMRRVDLLATPTVPGVAGVIAEVDTIAYRPMTRFTGVFNHTWQPSLSIPCGFTAAGLPVGLMLTGARFHDALVLRAGHAYQQVTDWRQRRPPAI